MTPKFLRNDAGKPSAMRFCVLLVLVALLLPDTVTAIRNNAPTKLDLNSVLMVLGALGLQSHHAKNERNKTP